MPLKKIFLLIAAALPWLATVVCTALQPESIMSFAQHPFGIVCLVIMAVWSGLGVLMTRMANPHIALQIIWYIFTPGMLTIPVLAPAILTIVKAMGPSSY